MKDIQSIVSRMTPAEKVALSEGANFWKTIAYEQYGIPPLFMCDGPHGLRKQDTQEGADIMGVHVSNPATCFPTAVTTAASWDPDLLSEIGRAIGEEAKDQGAGLVLGPGVNLKRNPLCGRNFEYFSEDPYLAGKLAAGFIRGIEGEGIGSSLKHFAANSQEFSRLNSDSIVDERTLRELYLTAFEIAVKEARPSTVMCAYSKLNGIHCSDNRELLTDILRDEWGFDGLVVSDWGAMCDRVAAMRAGCDLNMPGGSRYMEKEVLAALEDGTLTQADVDRCAERILRLVFRAAETPKEKLPCGYDAHHELARRAAGQGAVLLKNDGGVLPIKEGTSVALIGTMAQKMRYQGAGSSHINARRLSQPFGYVRHAVYAPGDDENGGTGDELIAEAVSAAKACDIAVIFSGLPDKYESEGFDREDMRMPEGRVRLIEAVAKANPNTVVVLFSGSVIECPWADAVKGILYMGLPGQAGGEAAADLLYGRANPCGKLAETWIERYEDCPSSPFFAKTKDALYTEGLYVGYRCYDKANKKVRWPFGHGLSYTTYAYSDLRVSGGRVACTVKNTGPAAGSEIVQLYIEAPQDGLHRPVRELKGFCKLSLEPGESKTAEFELTDRSFAVWDGGWVVPAGEYRICVGGSSRDLPLSAAVRREGVKIQIPAWQAGSYYERCEGYPKQEEFEKVIGRKYVPTVPKKGEFTMDNTVIEMMDHSLVMKIMYKVAERMMIKACGKKDKSDPELRIMMAGSVGSPLRSIQISGAVRAGVMSGLLEMANGHFFKGIKKIIRGR